MTNSFLTRLQAGEVLVADGATGTNLQLVGLPPGTAPEEWVFDQPDRILALQRSFVEAGSDLILTCTFGGTRLRLKYQTTSGDKLREDTQQQVVEGLFLIVHASVTVDCLHNRVRRQGVSTGKTVLKVRKLRDF